ncbi:hypothetical protein CEXT_90261 [Caerostris extrusa]|uniref:Uncharacterized protein n=1 Tax=Caerostris extrusa TaxID=172846 RepID=A0AAV4RQF3_CAEEX|nr:hypothetical protein CEXT_90261 [Caerostris extrusa]
MKNNCCNGEIGHVLCRDQEEMVSPENLNEKIRNVRIEFLKDIALLPEVISNLERFRMEKGLICCKQDIKLHAFGGKEIPPSKLKQRLAKMQICCSSNKFGNEITLCVLI